ncbi:WD repeat-containing protein 89-like protein [Pyrus ussuriensis x Pyrus communis]|uniref:WD repeat-containing protein 89-like protein n=1 Tax=Pyrus ussuriensis x Pyrus communis TaxID=2448454 RepID=A0A5N5G849_9ROSA|nr:WD repeat-containing protein 89-like protein [Pyrus ussuriensis x Pyrus communis]
MEATDMEVEELPPSNPDPFKRISLKNSIQTNFGDDYVFQIAPKYVPLLLNFYFLFVYQENSEK